MVDAAFLVVRHAGDSAAEWVCCMFRGTQSDQKSWHGMHHVACSMVEVASGIEHRVGRHAWNELSRCPHPLCYYLLNDKSSFCVSKVYILSRIVICPFSSSSPEQWSETLSWFSPHYAALVIVLSWNKALAAIVMELGVCMNALLRTGQWQSPSLCGFA